MGFFAFVFTFQRSEFTDISLLVLERVRDTKKSTESRYRVETIGKNNWAGVTAKTKSEEYDFCHDTYLLRWVSDSLPSW